MRFWTPARAALAASILAFMPAPALAQGLDDVPDEATVLEEHSDRTLTFSEFDTFVDRDPVPQIAGVTTDFMDGETVFGEVLLDTPLPRDELQSLREAGDPMSIHCARIRIFEIEGTVVLGGDGCDVVTP